MSEVDVPTCPVLKSVTAKPAHSAASNATVLEPYEGLVGFCVTLFAPAISPASVLFCMLPLLTESVVESSTASERARESFTSSGAWHSPTALQTGLGPSRAFA